MKSNDSVDHSVQLIFFFNTTFFVYDGTFFGHVCYTQRKIKVS